MKQKRKKDKMIEKVGENVDTICCWLSASVMYAALHTRINCANVG